MNIHDTAYNSWLGKDTIHTLASVLSGYTGSYDRETILTPFFGIPGVYPSISLSDFFSLSKIDLIKNLAGKYVFIGESGTLIHDAYTSPVTGTMMDGVESHANLLDGFLQDRFLVESTHEGNAYKFLIVLLSLISIVAYLFLPKFISPIVALITLVFLVFLSRYLYFNSGIVIEIFPVLLA